MAYVIDKLLVVSELLPYLTCVLLLLLTITKMVYYIFLKITNPNWEVGAVGIKRKSKSNSRMQTIVAVTKYVVWHPIDDVNTKFMMKYFQSYSH